MTLYTNDYLEYYPTLVGWIVNNSIWELLVASGSSNPLPADISTALDVTARVMLSL